jgi:hypothetical protein
METYYLPATTAARWNGSFVNPTPLHWMDPRTRGDAGYYPRILISYFHWNRTKFVFPEEGYVFGDSGGFSIMSLGANVDPRDVLAWQARSTNAGLILDVPPFADDKTGTEVGWSAGLARTVEHVRRALPIYETLRAAGNPFRWWGVIQGRSWEEMREWHQAISAVYPFTDDGEGWAFKAHPVNNIERD